jgi:hypothetical protein
MSFNLMSTLRLAQCDISQDEKPILFSLCKRSEAIHRQNNKTASSESFRIALSVLFRSDNSFGLSYLH